jgi:hypothetical protein
MDFTTDEFINKNIRVRPTSGITAMDKDEQKSDILGRGANLDGGQMDEEEKFNQMANLEIDAQRKTVKVKLERYMYEKQKQAAMEAAQKQKKEKK